MKLKKIFLYAGLVVFFALFGCAKRGIYEIQDPEEFIYIFDGKTNTIRK